MAQSHRESSRRLFDIAEQQQGFFTTKQAKAAGVRFLVTAPGLKQFDMTVADLDPKPDEIVPDGGDRLAELISQHYEIIHF